MHSNFVKNLSEGAIANVAVISVATLLVSMVVSLCVYVGTKVVKKKLVHSLQMNKTEKYGMICALALGYVTSGFAIARLGLLSTQKGVDWMYLTLKESIGTEFVSPYI